MGLMARHVLHGQITTFIWGEAYGGPQEILLRCAGLRDRRQQLLRASPGAADALRPQHVPGLANRPTPARAEPGARGRGADVDLAGVRALRARARDELLRDGPRLLRAADPARAPDRRTPRCAPRRRLRARRRARVLGDVADRPYRRAGHSLDDLEAAPLPALAAAGRRALRPRRAPVARLEHRARLGIAAPEVGSARLVRAATAPVRLTRPADAARAPHLGLAGGGAARAASRPGLRRPDRPLRSRRVEDAPPARVDPLRHRRDLPVHLRGGGQDVRRERAALRLRARPRTRASRRAGRDEPPCGPRRSSPSAASRRS